jgi:hypothetical protein
MIVAIYPLAYLHIDQYVIIRLYSQCIILLIAGLIINAVAADIAKLVAQASAGVAAEIRHSNSTPRRG